MAKKSKKLKLYDVYMDIGFQHHFYVWAEDKKDAEKRIKASYEAGRTETWDDVAPGSVDFHHWGPTALEDASRDEVLNEDDEPDNYEAPTSEDFEEPDPEPTERWYL